MSTTTETPPAPLVHIVTRRVPARLVVRRNATRSALIMPSGNVYPPPGTLWPLAVVDACPSCGAAHWHPVLTPDLLSYRRALCGATYLLSLIPSTIPSTIPGAAA